MQRTQAQEATQAVRMSWKPLMSKAEAEAYTRDSYYQGQDFYHGTSAEISNGIMTTGAEWEEGSENSYDYEIPSDESVAMFASRLFINQGYDAIEICGIQTLVVILNPQQVAVFNHERTT
jgi:hypothetical protein